MTIGHQLVRFNEKHVRLGLAEKRDHVENVEDVLVECDAASERLEQKHQTQFFSLGQFAEKLKNVLAKFRESTVSTDS
jgi:hypothetical protein